MSAASEAYYNSLSPGQKAAVDQSGAGPGGPNHDAWFQNAVKAGTALPDGSRPNKPKVDPHAGGPGEAGTGGNFGQVTPDMVRQNAKKFGLPEDYARFDDATINDWLSRWPYDPNTGKFTNMYGDKVDKPDERGPRTPRNRNGTGDQGDYGWGWNDSGVGDAPKTSRGGGGGQGQGQGEVAGSAYGALSDPLQAQLFRRFQGGQPFGGELGPANAQSLAQGGVWSWGSDQGNAGFANNTMAAPSPGVGAPPSPGVGAPPRPAGGGPRHGGGGGGAGFNAWNPQNISQMTAGAFGGNPGQATGAAFGGGGALAQNLGGKTFGVPSKPSEGNWWHAKQMV